MKIAIIGAAGNVGQRIVDEAMARGHDVTAIGRTWARLGTLGTQQAISADLTNTEETADVLRGHDVVVSSVRFTQYEPEMLTNAMAQSEVPRLVVVGGAGSLQLPDGMMVSETPNFPEAFKAEAAAGARLLRHLQKTASLDWTFLSPSVLFTAGVKTGRFRLGKDKLLVDPSGKSTISFEDFSVALLDEIEVPGHTRQRFTVGY